MKQLFTLLILTVCCSALFAQQHFTKTGHIWFYSEAPLEEIEAHNYQASSILDVATNDIVFKVNMTGFQFKKALMQEHFNEKYVESDKYPEAIFSGKIMNPEKVDFTQDGTYSAVVEGNLTIHNVTKPVKAQGDIVVKAGKVYAKSTFPVTVADYDIAIPSAVKDNIAKTIAVHVDISYEPKTK